MAKIVLNDTTSGSPFVINENFRKIEEALNDKVLYRVNPPANPNQMENALDMNGNDIINGGVIRARRIEAEESAQGEIPIAGEVDNNELIKWDKSQSKFVGSGLTSEKDGELTTASNSINIGVHDIGSGGRNVVAINRVDNRVFDFITQEIGLEEERNTNAFVRERGNIEDIAFNSDSSTVITDPSWVINAVSDQTVLGSSWWPAIDMDDVIYEIVEDGKVIYSENLGSFTADDLDFRFASTPYDLYQGQQYISRLRCADGSLCRFRGSADGTPWYTIKLRPFTNKELATKEYVDLNKGDILRVLYKTEDANEASQPIVAADTPQVVTFTEVTKESNFVEVDPATGEFTFLSTEPALVAMAFQVRRTGGGGDNHWGVFTEISIDDGQAWQVVPFSTVRETFSGAESKELHIISYTVPIIPEGAGMKVRFKQYADTTKLEIVSQPADTDGSQEPASAGAMFSVYTIQ